MKGDFLRLLIPMEGLSPAQRARAVALGSMVEAKMAKALADGANPDRLMAAIEKKL